jgi:glycosyltransferase involved in cell wall biosynthesis
MHQLSIVIITYNEEENIARCLESVKELASEIVVVDSLSADRTEELCRSYGCRFIRREFDGYGTQKQFAVDQASSDWVLSLDADEVLSDELRREIRETMEQPVIKETGFELRRSLVYLGKILRHGGAGNEYHLRLFNRRYGQFTQVKVHESIRVSGKTRRLKGEFLHYSYRNLSHHVEKLNSYTSGAAEEYVQKGKKYPAWWVAIKFPVSFMQFYCCKGGFLDGYPGFIWSLLGALYGSLKIAKTIELRKQMK